MIAKKKILFVITKGSPFGGAQRYVYDLATNLPNKEFEIIVAHGQGEALSQRLAEAGIRTIKIKQLQREIEAIKDFAVFKELVKIYKEEKPAIIHLNSSKIGFVGSAASFYLRLRGHKIKTIFTAHNWGFNDKGRSALSRFIYYIAHYFTLLFCDQVISVSAKTAGDMDWLPFVKNKIKVVHNGIGKFELLTKKEAREIFGVDPKKTLIFSLSELHKNKGLDLAIRALKILPEEKREKIVYCIAGTGEEKENLEKLIAELGLEENVKMMGFVPGGSKLLHGADIFLMPSRTEAFPYSLLEAGQAGLPIIATSVGGMPELIKDMQNGILVYPNNPTEIAEAINYILDHKLKAKEFAQEIKKTVTIFYSIRRMVEDTLLLYYS